MTYPVILYQRADCPNCGQAWAILPDPERGEDFYSHAAAPTELVATVAGPGAICPDCNMPLCPYSAVVTAGGQWLEVADGPKAVLN